jgi:hypothetical protein
MIVRGLLRLVASSQFPVAGYRSPVCGEYILGSDLTGVFG